MFKIESQLAGRFKIEAIAPDGSRRVAADWFGNLITDAGLNRLGTGNAVGTCFIGTGTSQPQTTDTGLTSYTAYTSNCTSDTAGAASSSPYYGWRQRVYRFAQGDAAGNMSEIGIGWIVTDSPLDYVLFSHARIKDGSGNDTTITVASDEILDVTYELRNYSPSSDVSSSIVISGTSYNTTLRAANVTNTTHWGSGLGDGPVAFFYQGIVYNGSLGAVTAQPSGTSAYTTTLSVSTYSNNSLKRAGTFTFSIDQGNLTSGVKCFYWSSATAGSIGTWQIEFDNYIPKDNTKTLTFSFETSWARKT